jgi:hypothetical protein
MTNLEFMDNMQEVLPGKLVTLEQEYRTSTNGNKGYNISFLCTIQSPGPDFEVMVQCQCESLDALYTTVLVSLVEKGNYNLTEIK